MTVPVVAGEVYLYGTGPTDGIFWLDVYLVAGCHTDERMPLY